MNHLVFILALVRLDCAIIPVSVAENLILQLISINTLQKLYTMFGMHCIIFTILLVSIRLD